MRGRRTGIGAGTSQVNAANRIAFILVTIDCDGIQATDLLAPGVIKSADRHQGACAASDPMDRQGVAGGGDGKQAIVVAGVTAQLAIPVEAGERVGAPQVHVPHRVFQLPIPAGEAGGAGGVVGGGHVGPGEVGQFADQPFTGAAGGQVTAVHQQVTIGSQETAQLAQLLPLAPEIATGEHLIADLHSAVTAMAEQMQAVPAPSRP